MEKFKNTLIRSFMHTFDFVDVGFNDLKKAYNDDAHIDIVSDKISKCTSTATELIDLINKSISIYHEITKSEKKPSKPIASELPNPPHMPYILEEMTPGNSKFLKGLAPDFDSSKNTA